eukprot:jgi/Botrbrau1/14803/Bobra.0370s0001.1
MQPERVMQIDSVGYLLFHVLHVGGPVPTNGEVYIIQQDTKKRKIPDAASVDTQQRISGRDGCTLIEDPCKWSSEQGRSLFNCLFSSVEKHGLIVRAEVLCASSDKPNCYWVRADMALPHRWWDSRHAPLKRNPCMARVFSLLHSPSAALPQPLVADGDLLPPGLPSNPKQPEPFSLAACFAELPSFTKPGSLKQQDIAAFSTTSAQRSLADLPSEVLRIVLGYLPRRDVQAMSQVCCLFRMLTVDRVPGLRLELVPHQWAAVMWMRQREAVPQKTPHPCWRPLSHPVLGRTLWANVATGELDLSAPEPVVDCRGGLFCDEPGLGKTITALALILRTKGTQPLPPEGAVLSYVPDSWGGKRAFYTVKLEDTPSSGTPRGTQRTRPRRRPSLRDPRTLSEAFAAAASEGAAQATSAPLPWAACSGDACSGSPTGPAGTPDTPSVGRLELSTGTQQATAPEDEPGERHTDPVRASEEATGVLVPLVEECEETHARNSDAECPEPNALDAGLGAWSRTPQTLAHVGTLRYVRRPFKDKDCDSRPPSDADRDPPYTLSRSHSPVPVCMTCTGRTSGDAAVRAEDEWQDMQDGSTGQSDSAARTSSGDSTLESTPEMWSKPRDCQTEPQADVDEPHQHPLWSGPVTKGRRTGPNAVTKPTERECLQTPRTHGGGNPSYEVQLTPEQRGKTVVGHASPDRGIEPPCASEEGVSACGGGCVKDEDGNRQKRVRFADAPSCGTAEGGNRVEDADVAPEPEPQRKRVRFAEEPTLEEQGCGAGGNMELDAEEEKEEEGATVWVQCEECHKWRDLPPGYEVQKDAPWFCKAHPDRNQQSCDLPQDDRMQKELLTSVLLECSGFVPASDCAPDPKLREHNERHYCRLLSQDPARVAASRIAKWVLGQEPARLLTPFLVPHQIREAPGWGRMLREFQFTPAPEGQGSRKGKGKSRTPSSTKKGAAAPFRWLQHPSCINLRFDMPALSSALEACAQGHVGEQTVFLSAATLVVIPGTLVSHWIDQLDRHADLSYTVLASDAASSSATPQSLAWDYDLVITTFQRLSNDWNPRKRWASPLMRVHWLRVILDEGHMLGACLSLTNKLAMASALRAERRWVMTGTPTPSRPSSDIAHLQPLLAFLGQSPYGLLRSSWDDAVQRPFQGRLVEGRARLMDLLRRIMLRSSKADLRLPPLSRKVTLLDFEIEHAHSYNALAEVVERNLLLADWGDPSHRESMLALRNSAWASQMLDNMRMSCCVAGAINLRVKEEDVQETLDLIADRLGYSKPAPLGMGPPWVDGSHPLANVEGALRYGAPCEVCGAHARLPCVTPCAHILCLACTSRDKYKCVKCGTAYRMQSVEDPERLQHNPQPKWDVPHELIEWQPSYTQKGAKSVSGGEWSDAWQVTKSSKVAYLMRRLLEIGAIRPFRPSPSPVPAEGNEINENEANDQNGDDVNANEANEQSGDGGGHNQKDENDDQHRDRFVAEKVIVFTQFWQHIRLIMQNLEAHGTVYAVFKRDRKAFEKEEAIYKFQHNPRCGVLLMDSAGAVGLDLSFVPWMILMEPLPDRSLEEQVVARAYRMGAKRPIVVETLVMKGTVEEQILAGTRALRGSVPGTAGGTTWDCVEVTKDPAEKETVAVRNRILSSVHRVEIASLPGQAHSRTYF